MHIRMMDDDNQPTPHFQRIVEDIVRNTLTIRKQVPTAGDFFCPAVCNKDGNVSYWGVLDFGEIPEEDYYIEAERRFYSATQCLGEENITGFGLVGMPAVIQRQPFVGMRKPPQNPFGPGPVQA